MHIKINNPLSFTEIGSKPNNEDFVCPDGDKLTSSVRCFVLCDGMGGHENGEVAAQIVASTLQPALMESATDPDVITRERFNAALKKAYSALNEMPRNSSGKTPGTTMTCLYLADNGALVAHIGDSRVYQVRPGEGVIFRTSDHSLVNELLKVGELTVEEARNFPRKNVITRAMQPWLETPYRADISILTDVRKGDYFFMCTDGILENVEDQLLVDILSKDESDEQKLEDIYTLCYGKTRDNYTCYLVPVESVEGEPLPTPGEEPKKEDKTEVRNGVTPPPPPTATVNPKAATNVEGINDFQHAPAHNRVSQKQEMQQPSKSEKAMPGWAISVIIIVGILLVVGALYFVFRSGPSATDGSNDNSNITTTPANVKPEVEAGTKEEGLDEPGNIIEQNSSDVTIESIDEFIGQMDELDETEAKIRAEEFIQHIENTGSLTPEEKEKRKEKLKAFIDKTGANITSHTQNNTSENLNAGDNGENMLANTAGDGNSGTNPTGKSEHPETQSHEQGD